MAVAEVSPRVESAADPMADSIPDLRALVRDYVRYKLFAHVPPGTPPPRFYFPLVTVGVEEEDIYASRPGAGDIRRRAEPDPDGSLIVLPRADPTGTGAVRIRSWARYLQRQLRGELVYSEVEWYTVHECYKRLSPKQQAFLEDFGQHGHAPKRIARDHKTSVFAVRRAMDAAFDALIVAIHRTLTTPRGLTRQK